MSLKQFILGPYPETFSNRIFALVLCVFVLGGAFLAFTIPPTFP